MHHLLAILQTELGSHLLLWLSQSLLWLVRNLMA